MLLNAVRANVLYSGFAKRTDGVNIIIFKPFMLLQAFRSKGKKNLKDIGET